MAGKIVVLVADGCEEIETVTVIDVLRRGEFDVVAAGLTNEPVVGSRNIRFIPDTEISKIHAEEYAAIVIPGGAKGADLLRRDERVLALIRQMNERGRLIAAICAAPLVLRDAGIIKGKRLTSYPSFRGEFEKSSYSDEKVVRDGNLLTSRGPGTAMIFALSIIEALAGKEKASNVARAALVSEF